MIEGTWRGIESAKKKIQQISKDLRDMTPAYKKCAIYLDQWVQRNFKGQGKPAGGWAPFSETTLKIMRRNDPKRASRPMLLIDTGEMRKSFLPFWSKQQAGIGSNLPRAKKHEEGGGNLPARRMLPKHKEVQPELKAIFNEHVEKALRK